MSKSFYLTTTLPYVNAEPHIGFALEMVQADISSVIVRSSAMKYFSTRVPTSTDSRYIVKQKKRGKTPRNMLMSMQRGSAVSKKN